MTHIKLPPSPPSPQFNRGWGGGSYQVVVGSVGIILREGDVDPQRHTVGKDGGEDEDVEGPGGGNRGWGGFRPPVFPITIPNPCPPPCPKKCCAPQSPQQPSPHLPISPQIILTSPPNPPPPKLTPYYLRAPQIRTYFHSTMLMAALRMGLLRRRQNRARGERWTPPVPCPLCLVWGGRRCRCPGGVPPSVTPPLLSVLDQPRGCPMASAKGDSPLGGPVGEGLSGG